MCSCITHSKYQVLVAVVDLAAGFVTALWFGVAVFLGHILNYRMAGFIQCYRITAWTTILLCLRIGSVSPCGLSLLVCSASTDAAPRLLSVRILCLRLSLVRQGAESSSFREGLSARIVFVFILLKIWNLFLQRRYRNLFIKIGTVGGFLAILPVDKCLRGWRWGCRIGCYLLLSH